MSDKDLDPFYFDFTIIDNLVNDVMVFASPSGQFYRDMTNPAHLSGPSHLDSFIVTRKQYNICQDILKPIQIANKNNYFNSYNHEKKNF
jgi:hypothetical protein